MDLVLFRNQQISQEGVMRQALSLGMIHEMARRAGCPLKEILIIANNHGIAFVRSIGEHFRKIPLEERGHDTLCPIVFLDELCTIISEKYHIKDVSSVILQSRIRKKPGNEVVVDLVINTNYLYAAVGA